MSMSKKIAWGITGAGAFLKESVDLLLTFPEDLVDVFLSRAGEEVLKMYALWDVLSSKYRVFLDRGASYPVSGRFSLGVYSLLVIAPATSNTVAKMAYGIADTLITNLFAQAGKAGVPSIILPTDVDDIMISESPSGERITLKRRKIDEENILRIKSMDMVEVVNSVEDIREAIARRGGLMS